MTYRDTTRGDAAKLQRMTRRAARNFKACRQLAYLAFGQDDSPVIGGR